MKLFISGKGRFNVGNLTPTMQRLKDFLERSQDGELFTAHQLARLLKVNIGTIQHDVQNIVPQYTYKFKTTRYWGNPRTIVQLKKETK